MHHKSLMFRAIFRKACLNACHSYQIGCNREQKVLSCCQIPRRISSPIHCPHKLCYSFPASVYLSAMFRSTAPRAFSRAAIQQCRAPSVWQNSATSYYAMHKLRRGYATEAGKSLHAVHLVCGLTRARGA